MSVSASYDVAMEIFDDPERRARITRREDAMRELRTALARRKEAPRQRIPDHPTSVAGAVAVKERAPSQKIQLLRAYDYAGERGFTDEQAAYYAGLLKSCYWRRCTDLRSLGYIEQPEGSPVRKGTSGVSRIICTITTEGVAYLASLK